MHAICLGAVCREVFQIAIDAWVACCVGLLHSIHDGDPVFAGQKWILAWQLGIAAVAWIATARSDRSLLEWPLQPGNRWLETGG